MSYTKNKKYKVGNNLPIFIIFIFILALSLATAVLLHNSAIPLMRNDSIFNQINYTQMNVNNSNFLSGYTWLTNPYHSLWSSTFNSTYDSKVSDNSTWNQSLATSLFAGIEWDYNQTTAAINDIDQRIQSGTSRPTCDVSTRGMIYTTFGALGIADKTEICYKSALNTYSWKLVSLL